MGWVRSADGSWDARDECILQVERAKEDKVQRVELTVSSEKQHHVDVTVTVVVMTKLLLPVVGTRMCCRGNPHRMTVIV